MVNIVVVASGIVSVPPEIDFDPLQPPGFADALHELTLLAVHERSVVPPVCGKLDGFAARETDGVGAKTETIAVADVD